MPPVSVLIKPASGSCNLRCSYCFYTDEVSRRAAHGCGVMSDETMECLIRRIFESAETQVSIGFQGGEPLLAGLAYYERFTRLAAAYNRRGVPVQYSIQTNGLLLDEDWAAFFRRHDFLVGISVDGLRETHDANRVDPAGGGSYGQVAAAIARLERRGVPFNILTVVNAQTAPRIREIYRDYMARGWVYQQYIPCLDPLGETPGGHPWSLTADAYGTFLCELFDLWYEDRRNGVFVYNRYFENLAALLLRYPTEACGMSGCCTVNLTVEADGSVYPCDFYALDELLLGNIRESSLEKLRDAENARRFVETSRRIDPACLGCESLALCRGGCRRSRQLTSLWEPGPNALCKAFQRFFPYAVPRLWTLL